MAEAENNTSYLSQVSHPDDQFYGFHQVGVDPAQTTLTFKFQNLDRASQALFTTKIKNSTWADFLYMDFARNFGSFYQTWVSWQEHGDQEKLIQWQQDNGGQLKLELWDGLEWQFVEYIPVAGPLGYREVTIPLDLPTRVNSSQEVVVRLTGGYLFWELDYAGLTFGTPQQIEPEILVPEIEGGANPTYKSLIENIDGRYLEQLKTGDFVELTFNLPPVADGMIATKFLRSRGYYEHAVNFTGLPRFKTLRDFENPGAFAKYSQQRYQEILSSFDINLIRTYQPI